ncbi:MULTISPECIES: XRE family transcriptional regulator [unclassified Acinetobacter]|uniref:LexA family protein n=1 Tax=unclassified Acinetobacter TaxID=196816 RepID=UPI0025767179|nr:MULTISPECIES: XRE family transcriptional regulator [unclassified Acinetobacter]MDM1766059.1 helix-turn-helix domain-containing protein [Acinetobacter sp. 226-1]MDM1769808.1 helix-turn-helix domain-containing protein [Acinetobacter sp. 226-4]
MTELQTIHEIRLSNTKKLMKELGLTRTEFAEKIEMSYNLVSQYIGKNPTKNIGDETAEKIEKAFHKPKGFLDQSDIAVTNQENSNVKFIRPNMAPVLSWVQAGTFTNVSTVDMSQVEEWLPLPDECTNCYYLKVQGISNNPDFLEGDYILVDPDVYYSDMQSGDMIVVRKFEDATFKKLVIETDGSRYLQALNPEFKPNVIPLDENCNFVGQVIDCIRYTYRAKRRKKCN